jgi:hypothetical protein
MAKQQLSGIQIPTLSKLNIDGEFTLDAASGSSGQVMISQGAGNTPIWTSTPNLLNPLLTSISTVGGGGSEGGQINFARTTDGSSYWYIDTYGATSTPDLRVIENTNERFRFVAGGALSVGGATGSSGQVLTSAGGSASPTWTTPHIVHAPVANYTIGTTTTANATISGSAFSKVATLAASTTYLMEGMLFIQSVIGTGTGSNLILGWNTGGGGGASGNIQTYVNAGLASLTTSTTTNTSIQITNFSNTTLITSPAGTQIIKVVFQGIVRSGSISAYNIYPTWSVTNSSTPGVPTSLTTLVGSYIQYTPLTSSASDVSIGTWA